jgi:hypothetical protein
MIWLPDLHPNIPYDTKPSCLITVEIEGDVTSNESDQTQC